MRYHPSAKIGKIKLEGFYLLSKRASSELFNFKKCTIPRKKHLQKITIGMLKFKKKLVEDTSTNFFTQSPAFPFPI